MGFVDLALRQEGRFRRLYAIKRLHPHHRHDAGFRAMFMDEGRLAGMIRDPNVVSVHDVGEDAEGPFLVMDYVDGISLAAIIKGLNPDSAALPLALCVSIAAQTARGLHAAHEVRSDDGAVLGLVHRDVSPQNILAGFDGTVRVTDFGIAKALGNVNRTATGFLKGNVGYMSPEQLRFEEPDRRSDLFSLGVVLYEALGRRRLYRNDDANQAARRILSEPPPDIQEVRADAPPELVQLLFELLAKERELRPESALAVAERLEALRTYLEATEGRFDLAVFLSSHFSEQRAKTRAEVAEAMTRSEAGDVGATPAPVEGGSTSVPVVVQPQAPRRRRRAVVWTSVSAGVAVAAALAVLASTRGPAPARTGSAATVAVAPAVPVSARPVTPPPAPAPATDPEPESVTPPPPTAHDPAPSPPPRRLARSGAPSRPRAAPASAGVSPAAPTASTTPPNGLLRLPRSERGGVRKLEVPLATDWQ
jgi:serine/threonine-protein kinase